MKKAALLGILGMAAMLSADTGAMDYGFAPSPKRTGERLSGPDYSGFKPVKKKKPKTMGNHKRSKKRK